MCPTLQDAPERQPYTTTRNRLLVRLAKRHRFSSARQLLNYWGEQVSKFTVYRRLRDVGLRPYRILKRPFLTAVNRAARLRWAQQRVL